MNPSNRDYDDLKKMIKGIGPARERWLRESLGVRTFGDLAALTVDEIESRLKADKQIASRETIESWIAQARDLAAVAERTEKPTATEEQVKETTEENEIPSQPAEPVSEGDDGEKELPTTQKDGWKPFASFIVEFQERTLEGQPVEYRTTVHHMEADTGTNWPGIERDKHCHWMVDQLGAKISEQPAEELPVQPPEAEPIPAARSLVSVAITQIQAFQPPQVENIVGTGKANQPFEGTLKGNQPFAIEIGFDLLGEAAADLSKEKPVFIARFNVQDQSTGESTHLGDAEPGSLVNGELAYTAMLSEVTLPPGTYRLFAQVTLQATSVRPDFVVWPEFKVVR